MKSLFDVEELKRVQELRIDEFSRRRLIENQDTIFELTGKIQELQNAIKVVSPTSTSSQRLKSSSIMSP